LPPIIGCQIGHYVTIHTVEPMSSVLGHDIMSLTDYVITAYSRDVPMLGGRTWKTGPFLAYFAYHCGLSCHVGLAILTSAYLRPATLGTSWVYWPSIS
jgi:hypothetical protein